MDELCKGDIKNIFAIIVTFYPDRVRLEKLIVALESQVNHICIVDNGSPYEVVDWLAAHASLGVRLVSLGENRGVACAHNIGIRMAEDIGATHVILFDQDSLPDPHMVSHLLSAEARLLAMDVRVGALGPFFYDPRDGFHYPFIRLRGWRVERITKPDENGVCFADYLITSGCLIRLECLKLVGGMRDDLFIDYVDIEWGLRLKHHGLCNVGVFDAHMEHVLGDSPVRFLGKRLRIPMHNPTRHYYHFRNAVLLYRDASIPISWKLADSWRLLLKYCFYTLFTSPRFGHLRMINLGIWHGLRGEGGKLKGS